MHQLDVDLLLFLNGFVGRFPTLDQIVRGLLLNYLIRGAFLFPVIVWIWYSQRGRRGRVQVLSGLFGVCLAIGVSLAVQAAFPFQVRPVLDSSMHVHLYPGIEPGWLNLGHLNSFPSDTATMYFALATLIFAVNRRLGWLAFVWVLAIVAFPRVYFALHYPSDIAGGLLLGVSVTTGVMRLGAVERRAEKLLDWFQGRREALLEVLLFVFLTDMSHSFEGTHHILHALRVLILR